MAFSDILSVVLPELEPMIGLDQQNPYHLYNVWEHSVRAVEQVPPDPVIRWAMLLHDCGKPSCKTIDEKGIGHFYGHPAVSKQLARQILLRLRFSRVDTERILLLVEQHDRPLGDTEKLVRRRLCQIGELRFRDLLSIKKGDIVGQGTHPENLARLQKIEKLLNSVLAADACFSLKHLAVNGNDLRHMGLSGPAVGTMLYALLDAVMEEQVENDRDALLARACARMEAQDDQ